MKEVKSSLLPTLSIRTSIIHQNDRADSLSANPFLANNNSMKRVRQFLEKNKKISIKENETRKSIHPISPTMISINFMKKQDGFYRKMCHSGESELLEVFYKKNRIFKFYKK